MKAHLANCIKRLRIIVGLITILIVTILFLACATESNTNSVICNLDENSLYPDVVGQILPTFTIKQSDNLIYYALEDGAIGEAFDTQAAGALETGIARY